MLRTLVRTASDLRPSTASRSAVRGPRIPTPSLSQVSNVMSLIARALLVISAVFLGLVELGWSKALDITENEDRLVRERERADLAWWVTEARRTIELGLLDGVVV